MIKDITDSLVEIVQSDAISETKNDYQNLSSSIEKIEESVENILDQNESLESELESLKSDMTSLKTQISSLTVRIYEFVSTLISASLGKISCDFNCLNWSK